MTEKTGQDSKAMQDGNQNQTPAPNPEPQKPADDDTVQVRKGEYSGLKTQLRQLQKWKEEQESARAQEDQAKLKAAQDWDTLERKLRSEIDSAKAEAAAQKRAVITERARNALLAAGMPAKGLAVDGALSKLPSEIEPEAIGAWVDEVRNADPDAFRAPTNPIGVPSVGAVARPSGDEAGSIKADWAAALKKGPDALAAVKRRVDQYMRANGGKNPLA